MFQGVVQCLLRNPVEFLLHKWRDFDEVFHASSVMGLAMFWVMNRAANTARINVMKAMTKLMVVLAETA
jgi:hypothetical protein